MRIMPVYTIFRFPQTSWPKLQASLLVNNELKFLLILWPTYLTVFNCINGFKLCFYIRIKLFIFGTYSMSNHKVPTEYDSFMLVNLGWVSSPSGRLVFDINRKADLQRWTKNTKSHPNSCFIHWIIEIKKLNVGFSLG